MKFEYEIKEFDDIDDVMMNFESSRNPSSDEKISVKIVDGKVDIIGNRAGWEYLAKICLEMSYCADKDPHFHLHREENLVDALQDESIAVNFYIND